jgi:hypothetical protein
MNSDPFAGVAGYSRTDEGPIYGSSWWFGASLIGLIIGSIAAWGLFFDRPVSEERRQMAVVIFVAAALPLTVTVVQVVRLLRKIGRARLFLEHDSLPLAYKGTATYIRPMRGASLRRIEARLQCKEELTKGSGKSKRIYTAVVFDEMITPMVTPGMEQLRVQLPLRIPERGPASLFETRASIEWYVRLRLEMDGCPDTRSSFQLSVLPALVKR